MSQFGLEVAYVMETPPGILILNDVGLLSAGCAPLSFPEADDMLLIVLGLRSDNIEADVVCSETGCRLAEKPDDDGEPAMPAAPTALAADDAVPRPTTNEF